MEYLKFHRSTHILYKILISHLEIQIILKLNNLHAQNQCHEAGYKDSNLCNCNE